MSQVRILIRTPGQEPVVWLAPEGMTLEETLRLLREMDVEATPVLPAEPDKTH